MQGRVINQESFVRMACGNIPEFKGLAVDFLADVRRLFPSWREARAGGFTPEIQREIHRCKGGASLFAMERLRELLARLEKENAGLGELDAELDAAEKALAELP